MPASVLDRLGLGGERAVANARHEMLRPEREAELVARLVEALARRDARGSLELAAAPPTVEAAA